MTGLEEIDMMIDLYRDNEDFMDRLLRRHEIERPLYNRLDKGEDESEKRS